METAESILDAAAVRTGWDDQSKVDVLLEYIENQCDNDTFANFIAERVEAEEGR